MQIKEYMLNEPVFKVDEVTESNLSTLKLKWLIVSLFAVFVATPFSAAAVLDWAEDIRILRQDANASAPHAPEFDVIFVMVQTLLWTFAFGTLVYFFVMWIFFLVFQKSSPIGFKLELQQQLVLILLFLYICSPGTNVGSLFCIWRAMVTFYESPDEIESSAQHLERSFYFSNLQCLNDLGDWYRIFSIITTVLTVTLTPVLFDMVRKPEEHVPKFARLQFQEDKCCNYFYMGIFAYITFSCAMSIGFDFLPSDVPLVEIVSVIQVCSREGFCGYRTVEFWRAFTQCVQAAAEFYLYVILPYQWLKERRFSAWAPFYTQNLTRYSGFYFVQLLTIIHGSIGFLCCFFLVFVTSHEAWICSSIDECLSLESSGLNAPDFDVLARTGIGSSSSSFVPWFLLISLWLSILALLFLPAGTRSFGCSKFNENGAIGKFTRAFFFYEKDFSEYSRSYNSQAEVSSSKKSRLECQVKECAFCFETEVMLLNQSAEMYKKKHRFMTAKDESHTTEEDRNIYEISAKINCSGSSYAFVGASIVKMEDRIIISFLADNSLKWRLESVRLLDYSPFRKEDKEIENIEEFVAENTRVRKSFMEAYNCIHSKVVHALRIANADGKRRMVMCTGKE